MGIFDFLKRHKGKCRQTRIGTSFREPAPISNEEYQKKRRKENEHWECCYDLSTVHGISSIPLPKRKIDSSGTASVTGQLEYYLMHKAGLYEKDGKTDLAIACYRKANELMPMSPFSYQRDRYMRLPRYLRKLRRFDEARAEEAKINALFGENHRFLEERGWAERRKEEIFRGMKQFNTDLVEASYIRCCCAECAKYRERVYSVSGTDRRFPRLPDYLLSGTHDCGISLFPFIDGVSSMRTRDGRDLYGKGIVKYSNRPFVDDRTPDELADLEEIQKRKAADAARERSRADYDWLWELFPQLCPKSFSGYMRIKNANTENFQKLAAKAKELGRDI